MGLPARRSCRTCARYWRVRSMASTWMIPTGRRLMKKLIRPIRPVTVWGETQLRRVNKAGTDAPDRPHPLCAGDIAAIRLATLDYVSSMRVTRNGEFLGYRYSKSCTAPLLYGTLAALLLKHL